ncbi:MAG: hypothetical protein DCC43_14420, partial [Candidatus Brocadia sp.]
MFHNLFVREISVKQTILGCKGNKVLYTLFFSCVFLFFVFQQAYAQDSIPPTVSATSPVGNEVGVDIYSAIAVTFSEEMDANTITTATFIVTDGVTPVVGTVDYAGTTATFTPIGNLSYATNYTATITTGATDLAGNALVANYSWGFTAGAAPPQGLQAYYALDEGNGTVANDLSGNGNDGTINGAAWSTGKGGGGLSFDGSNDSVAVPRMNNDEVSVCAWFYKNTNDLTRNDALFSGYRHSSNQQLREGFELRFPASAPNRIEFVLVTQDGNGVRTTRTTQRSFINSAGSWYHVVGTYNKTTGVQKLYVNGEVVHTQTHVPGNTIVPLVFYADMRIGYSRVNNGYFNGVIDNILLYNRVLDDKEIRDLYNAFTFGLQARYAFSEGTGIIVGDSSGNGNHGSISGGAAWTSGKNGGGLNFDGINDRVSIPRMNYDEVSVGAWCYKNANDASRNDAIFSGFRNNSNVQLCEGFELRFPASAPNTVQFLLVTQNGSGVRTLRTAQWDLGNSVGSWYHVTGIYSKATGEQRLYVNGQLVNTQTHPAGNTIVPLTQNSDMRIGHSWVNNGYFHGILDDVRLYKQVLSDQEVLDLFNSPTVSATSPVSNETNVAVNGAITVTFSEAMDANT